MHPVLQRHHHVGEGQRITLARGPRASVRWRRAPRAGSASGGKRAQATRRTPPGGQPVAKASGQGDFSIGEIAIGGEALEAWIRAGYDTLKALEEKGFLSTVAANLAQVLYWRGKYQEADRQAVESGSLGVEGDVTTQVGWRVAKAMLLTRHGQISEGEALAREAVERATATEYFSLIAESYLALAEVLRLSERAGEASEALEHALRVYEGKGFAASADAIRARLAELHATANSIH